VTLVIEHAGGWWRARTCRSRNDEFVAYAKTNKDKMQFASAGTGSANSSRLRIDDMVTGIDIVHVPYRVANPRCRT